MVFQRDIRLENERDGDLCLKVVLKDFVIGFEVLSLNINSSIILLPMSLAL
jgi:hypothetical protein